MTFASTGAVAYVAPSAGLISVPRCCFSVDGSAGFGAVAGYSYLLSSVTVLAAFFPPLLGTTLSLTDGDFGGLSPTALALVGWLCVGCANLAFGAGVCLGAVGA